MIHWNLRRIFLQRSELKLKLQLVNAIYYEKLFYRFESATDLYTFVLYKLYHKTFIFYSFLESANCEKIISFCFKAKNSKFVSSMTLCTELTSIVRHL